MRALGHRDYRLFFAGQIVSLIGTWMQSVGQAWLVLELTNSPFKLGLLGTLQFGPMLLFAFLSGAIADRVRKRRLILATQSALMLQAFALSALAWTGHVQYWHVAVLATLYGLVTTLDMPARQSFMTDLVGRNDLPGAIALNSAVFNGARVVGPAVAGLLVARYGVALAFLLNGLSFLAVIGALRAMRTEGEPRPRTGATMLEDIAEGARYAVATPLIALILALCCAVSLFVLNYNTLVPLIARDVLGEGAHGFGLLMAALGAGAVLGALVLARLDFERPPASLLLWAALAASAATLSLAFVHRFWVAAPVLFVAGFAQILFAASSNTHAPDERARPSPRAHDEPLRVGVRGLDADRRVLHRRGGRAARRPGGLRGGWRVRRGGGGNPRGLVEAAAGVSQGRPSRPTMGILSAGSFTSTPKVRPSRLISRPSSQAARTPSSPSTETCPPVPLGLGPDEGGAGQIVLPDRGGRQVQAQFRDGAGDVGDEGIAVRAGPGAIGRRIRIGGHGGLDLAMIASTPSPGGPRADQGGCRTSSCRARSG